MEGGKLFWRDCFSSMEEIIYDKYCIPTEYKTNPEYVPLDVSNEITEKTGGRYQVEVYMKAEELSRLNNCKKILDIGCGSGYKLVKYFIGHDTLGIEVEPNYSTLTINYPNRRWMMADYSRPLDEEFDMVICADVLEHVVDPDIIMKYIVNINPKCIVFSTPAREILGEKKHPIMGPPYNRYHIREWTSDEFSDYVSKWFDVKGVFNKNYYLLTGGILLTLIRKNG